MGRLCKLIFEKRLLLSLCQCACNNGWAIPGRVLVEFYVGDLHMLLLVKLDKHDSNANEDFPTFIIIIIMRPFFEDVLG